MQATWDEVDRTFNHQFIVGNGVDKKVVERKQAGQCEQSEEGIVDDVIVNVKIDFT